MAEKEKKSSPIYWRLPTPLLAKTRKEASRLGIPLTQFITYTLIRYFEEREDRR